MSHDMFRLLHLLFKSNHLRLCQLFQSKSDAIQVCLEHSDGYSAEVFFPYAVADDGHLVYGPIFAQEGKRDLFCSGSRPRF
jgi:hypothetical protein